ncbi:MAG TPA: acyltransferase family protein [Candidatus Dormibacteraeota bacterium]|nr:acyltransferase family protein [Candidatus Dormibacteraeota bacterium]
MKAASQRPRHLDAVDLMRIVTIVGVVAVHVVSFTNRETSVAAGAVSMLLHVNREIFFLVTALVLTYTYGSGRMALGRFWKRRYYLVATPYLVCSVAYFIADGDSLLPLSSALHTLGVDILTGAARYHLYFLLVTMQFYLVFPLVRWLVRVTKGHHLMVCGISLLVQILFEGAVQAQLPLPGLLGDWIKNPDAVLPSYQFFVLVGAVAAVHIDEIMEWTRRHRLMVAGLTAAAVAIGLGWYAIGVYVQNLQPVVASQVFQPAVVLETIAFSIGLLAIGVVWQDHRRDGLLSRWVTRASHASFGIYLLHPLVLQGLIGLLTVVGYFAYLAVAPAGVTLSVGLFVLVPLTVAITWLMVGLIQRSPLSVALTGRERPKLRPRRVRRARSSAWRRQRRPVLDAMGSIGVASLASMLIMTHVFAEGVGTNGGSDPIIPTPIHTATPQAAPTGPTDAPTGTTEANRTVDVSGITRTYQVITPVHPSASTLPVLIVLHGISASVAGEEQRDELVPLAATGQAILVYPVGYDESWNAGDCCGPAAAAGVNDVGFLTDVVQQVRAMQGVDDNRISLIGFSNGGRMVYKMEIEDPQLIDAVVVVAAVNEGDFAVGSGKPVPALEIATTGDPEVAYSDVQTEVARWRDRDHCQDISSSEMAGTTKVEHWNTCSQGTEVELATYAGTQHVWPEGDGASTPSSATLIWDFLSPLT